MKTYWRHRGWADAWAMAGTLAGGMMIGLTGGAWADPLAIVARNTVNLPASATDQTGRSFTIAGLSGLTYAGEVAGAGRWWAVMDNSDSLIELSVTLGSDGRIVSATVLRGLRLADVRDFEDIAWAPAPAPTVLLAEEGSPEVREYRVSDGGLVRTLPRPAVFAQRRANFGFESLSRRADGSVIWTANEEALTPDGPLSTSALGTTVRLLRYDVAAGVATPAAQFAYACQPLHGSSISGARSGLSALMALPDGRLVALERSFALGATLFQSRVYELTLTGATDVSGLPGLIGQSYTPVSKRLMLQASFNNLEGLALGPRLDAGGGTGRWSVLGIVDDGDPISVNQLVAFELTGDIEPPCAADFNGDGFLDFFDFDDFVVCFEGGACPPGRSGDFNGDGFADFFDYDDFVAAFEAGC